MARKYVIGRLEHAWADVGVKIEHDCDGHVRASTFSYRSKQFAFNIVQALCALCAVQHQEDAVNLSRVDQVFKKLFV